MRELTVRAAGPAPSALAPLHNAWLATLTGVDGPPSEPKATCSDCVMCGGVERSGSQVTFAVDTKCCTYVPHLANFLVGQSLLGPGRQSITDRIDLRAGVTPLGLGLSFADIYRIAGAQSHFGRSAEVVCPHFVATTQGCAIWQTRNAVCSTWFCQHERGAVTQRFWHAVRDLLIAAEERIAHHCLSLGQLPDEQTNAVLDYRAGIREAVARANSGDALPEAVPDDESRDWYARMWGDWAGREDEWFRRCAKIGSAITEPELLAQMQDVRHLSQAVTDRWNELSTHELPERLTFNPGPGSTSTPDVLRLVGYSPFDPLVLPAALLADLRRLDGRELRQLREGTHPHASPLDDNLLGQLHDFGIAIPTESPHKQPTIGHPL